MFFILKVLPIIFTAEEMIAVYEKAETPASAFVSFFNCYFNLFINSVLSIGVDIADAFFLRRNLAF